MTVSLFYTGASAPCRVVLLVAAALDLQLNLNEVDLQTGEHLKPSFLKMNPQHTVPTILDGEFSLWESRAIGRYLINKYGADSGLYPEDPQTRALVDQRLDFDLGTLYPKFGNFFYPTLFGDVKPDAELLKQLEAALGFLNAFLEGQEYAVGSQLTLADLSLVATVSTIEVAGIRLEPYPNVTRWLKLVKSTAPGYKDANQKGVDEFKDFVKLLKSKKTEL